MTIVDVDKGAVRVPDAEVRGLLAETGIRFAEVRASRFSFVTAMRIAKAVDSHGAEAVLTHTLSEAMAALSGRKIARHPYPIICAPESAQARHIVPQMAREIDAWIFDRPPATTLQLRNQYIVPTYWPEAANQPRQEAVKGKTRISWIGPVTDRVALEQTIRTAATLPHCELHIYGTGAARTVMPCVQLARTLPELSVTWHGDDYDEALVVAQTDIAVTTSPALTQAEARCRVAGVPVAPPYELAQAVAGHDRYAKFDISSLTASHHARRWQQIILELANHKNSH